MPKQKTYLIRINDDLINHRAMWYWNKQGQEFEAVLGVSNSKTAAVFIIGGGHYVYPVDCTIVKEWTKEK